MRLIVTLLIGLWAVVVQATTQPIRDVPHAMGNTLIEGRPERLVTLYQGATDSALALGLEPVGVVESWLERPMYRYLRDDLPEGVDFLGLETQPDLEGVAGLSPDLIVGARYRHAAVYPLLSRIAPTVLADSAYDFESMLQMIGKASGRPSRAQQLIDRWHARVDDFRCRTAAEQGPGWQRSASVVSFRSDHARLYYDGFARRILDQVGLQRPDGQGGAGWGVKLVSRERLPAMDADIIFVFMRDEPRVAELHREWTSHPLWENLRAVRQGRVFYVDPVIWSMGGGIQAANRLLDELYTHFGLNDQGDAAC